MHRCPTRRNINQRPAHPPTPAYSPGGVSAWCWRVARRYCPTTFRPRAADGATLREAVAKGITVVQCTRAGSGRTFRGKGPREYGFLIADNLTPRKARLLLALALTISGDPAEITRMFATY
jgi:Glutaminase/Asparaginase C-terminal domain